MAFVNLAQAYADFDQGNWAGVDACLDDDVVLYNYDIPAGQPGHQVGPGKAAVLQALQSVRGEIQQYWQPSGVDMPPHNPAGLVPGGAAVDRLVLSQTPNPTPRRTRRIQRGPHSCADLFRFNPANGKIIEIHYCVADGP